MFSCVYIESFFEHHSLFRPVALYVAFDVDLDRLAGREKAVADALLQGVGVVGLTETGDIGHVLRLLRCRGDTDPGGRGVVFRHLAPCRIGGGAAAVRFIDHDRVEKVGRELPVRLPVCLRPGDHPIESGIVAISSRAAMRSQFNTTPTIKRMHLIFVVFGS